MWRNYNLDYLFLMYCHNFIICLVNIISKYLLPNIFAMLLTLVAYFAISVIRRNIKIKFFSSLFTIVFMLLEIFFLILFAKLFGVYSLVFTFITIIVIGVEIFKEI